MSLINTVDKNKYRNTRRSYLKSQLSHKIQSIIGRYYTKDSKLYVAKNDMVNWPITLDDMNVAEDIFGRDKYYLQVNTMLSKPHQFQSTYINIPKDIMEK